MPTRRPYSWKKTLHKPQRSGLLLVKPYGAGSYLPPPIFVAATEHWVLDAYEGFIDLLRNPRASRKHHTPLMDT